MNGNRLVHNGKTYILDKTCDACPEQYDVYAGNDGLLVGYIRYRSDQLLCYPYIKEHHINDDIDNVFPDFDTLLLRWVDKRGDGWGGTIPDDIRDTLIKKCLDAIEKFHSEKK